MTSLGGSVMVFSSSARPISSSTTPFQRQAEPHLALCMDVKKPSCKDAMASAGRAFQCDRRRDRAT